VRAILEIHVDLVVRPGGEAAAAGLTDALVAAFSGDLFARDDARPVEEIVLDLCREQGLTLATAESCTGGLIGARLTEVAGASDVFLGGVIAYSNEVKEKQLGVPNDLLREHGAVSAEVGAAMAAGARTALGADLAIADTGIAGPGGGTSEKPVGLVFLAVDGPGGPTRRACSSLETGRPSGRGRPCWLCTHCGGSCRVPTRRGLRTGARVEGDERLRLFCALLLPPAAVDGLVAWQTAELAPRGEKLRSSPRKTSTSRSRFSARRPQLERGRWPRPCGRRVRATSARCSPWAATTRRGAWR
jgi:PncC family amidohydrolase